MKNLIFYVTFYGTLCIFSALVVYVIQLFTGQEPDMFVQVLRCLAAVIGTGLLVAGGMIRSK